VAHFATRIVRYDYDHFYSEPVAFDASAVANDESRLTFVTFVASRIPFKASPVAFVASRDAHDASPVAYDAGPAALAASRVAYDASSAACGAESAS
jgi:hypothetical protein